MNGPMAAVGIMETEREFLAMLVLSVFRCKALHPTAHLVLVLFVLLSSCSRNILDANLAIAFDGKITDTESGAPVEQAELLFVDLGLDQWRASPKTELFVSRSDSQGVIRDNFIYSYGYQEGIPRERSGKFALRVRKSGCLMAEETYRVTDLKRFNGRFELSFQLEVSCSKSD